MTPTLATQRSDPRATTVQDPPRALRLRLKPKAPTTGRVDGGWWPRSWDLAAELPDLLAVLAVRLGRIERVSYHLGEWGPTAHKIKVDGSVVRLDGFRTQHVNTVDVLAARQRVTLLVVPPEMSAQAAHTALTTAGHRGNTSDIESLLPSEPPIPRIGGPTGPDGAADADAAQQRWELDGGHL
jgi:Family of unknown function (DUF5994)